MIVDIITHADIITETHGIQYTKEAEPPPPLFLTSQAIEPDAQAFWKVLMSFILSAILQRKRSMLSHMLMSHPTDKHLRGMALHAKIGKLGKI